ncbi:flavin-containing monooxygenase [Streptomyces sp. LE64]|uniref:flavin-containing monooxygenase n=1 Tax=Streptomyces sp. LE64 TaxID=3448653 RepID=UPI00404351CE
MAVSSDHDKAALLRTDDRPVYVIGGGPGGLATAYALRARGVRAVVLERTDHVGASWRGHYDRLRLHTTRRRSALPGLSIPRAFGRWVARDHLVRYLEKYAEHHELEVVTGVEVHRVDRSADGADWVLRASGGRELVGAAVVVATGYNHTPHLPDWPGATGFAGTLVHASRYRRPDPYAGQDVLVVGSGNTGAEIAVDLAEGGATRVRLAVRTVPHVLRRTTLGWPSQANAVVARRLPPFVVDPVAALMARLTLPDLSAHGLPRPGSGLLARAGQGALPIVDTGFVKAVRAGRIEVVAAVESFAGGEVVLADGERIAPESVIAATGYERGLAPLVGHLGVLAADGRPLVHGRRCAKDAPGLYFTGFTNPISGMLRELARDAPRIAAAVARGLPAARGPREGGGASGKAPETAG